MNLFFNTIDTNAKQNDTTQHDYLFKKKKLITLSWS